MIRSNLALKLVYGTTLMIFKKLINDRGVKLSKKSRTDFEKIKRSNIKKITKKKIKKLTCRVRGGRG